MRRLLLILILTFSFQSWTNADDIRDFQIEGMSIGDSLLDHFSKKEILASKVNWYNFLEKNKFITIALESSDFQIYEYVDINTKYGDNKYIIDSMAGSIYFGKDKEIKDINHCYIKQKEIAKDLSKIFKNSKKNGPTTSKHLGKDPSGKSTYTDIYFIIDNNYQVVISCYDYSDHLKSEGSIDFLAIVIRSKKFDDWLSNY